MAFPNNFKRSGKYNAHQVERHGIKFDSEREADRWDFLIECQRKGLISELQRQVEFVLIPDEYTEETVQLKTKTKKVRKRTFIGVRYKADFVYYHNASGRHVVEDTKISPKMIPKDYQLKEKMMHSLLHIDIRRVYKPKEPI